MVQVRSFHSAKDDAVNVDAWLARIQATAGLSDIERLSRACSLAQRASLVKQQGGEAGYNSFFAGLEMAEILADLHLDIDSLVAAVLYRSVREEKLPLAIVQQEFGATVAKLVEGVRQMAAISAVRDTSQTTVLGDAQRQLENIRKMLVALVDDVRVALIKLAERTWALRAVKNESTGRRGKVAREVFDIYAPLAHRLGIGHIKWELEDIAFRYLSPDAYKRIARLLDERRLDRQNYISSVIKQLEEKLRESGIEPTITGRAKHIYSIWRKMQRKKIDFFEVYDVRAVRILVPEIKDCYAALGIVHALWRHIPKEFDDYIATPKRNGYQSLHTAVVGPEGRIIEVQIRTHEMHEEAEFGVCSHWRYKGTDRSAAGQSYEEKIEWLRQVLQWHEEVGDLSTLADELQLDIEPDRIYVFTPAGHVIDLPSGATPIDFAYRVHTEIGHHCKGAKVNGRIVPLNYPLKTGERIEVLTSKSSLPSRDWLNPALSYAKASRTRTKIQHWFKQQDKEKNAQAGRDMLEEEFRRVALPMVDFDAIAPDVNYKNAEDMFAAIGAGDLRISQVTALVQQQVEPPQDQLALKIPAVTNKKSLEYDLDVEGVGNLMSHVAGCCKPVPGDECIGYITVGRGISIHRSDCANAIKLCHQEPERIIAVHWSGKPEGNYPVEILIQAFDRPGLLRDITLVLANDRVNVTSVASRTDEQNNWVDMRLTIEVPDLDVLGKVLAKINQLPNMIEVKRYKSGG